MGTVIQFPRRQAPPSSRPSMSLADLDRLLRRAVPPMPTLPGDEVFERINTLMRQYELPKLPDLNILERISCLV